MGGQRAPVLDEVAVAGGVVDRRFDLRPVAHDAGVLHQALNVLPTEAGHLSRLETSKHLTKALPLPEDRDPREPGLEAFEADLLEQASVVDHRSPPLVVVVCDVERISAGPGTTRHGRSLHEVTNDELWARAQEVLPGGVNSPVRSFGSVGGGTPYFVARGEGARVWDVDGREYIDYVQSYGASILGHAHPAIVEAVQAAAARGTTYGAPTENEVLLAEEVCRRVPGLDMVRMTSSGTEATMSAIRLARGVTGRDRIVKFAGNYHGHSDALLAEAGSGVANQGLPGSAGVPAAAVQDTIVVPYNEIPHVDGRVAVVCVEPVAANAGLIPPADGFLEGLRTECDRIGALLMFDEVITGFRVGAGGAAPLLGVRPDLWCFGKVIGGGLPVGMFGANRDVMNQVAPLGPVYQGGTLSGNPLATAAGLAALHHLDDAAYERLEATAVRLQDGLAKAMADAGVPAQVPRWRTLVGIFPGAETPVTSYEDAKRAAATELYAGLFRALLERGIAFAPGPYEILFPSLAHTDADIDRTIEAVADAAATL